MKAQYRKLSLVAACMLILWLMTFFLGHKSSQNGLSKKARTHPRTCDCPRDTLRSCMCSTWIRECSACLHTPGDSDWFDRHFKRGIEPLLRAEDPASSEALAVWLGMTSEKEFENWKQQPIKMSPSHRESSCLTCAVVGNSRFLRGSGLGFRINQHDMVLRMNQAPVQGFETDVGNVTTVRIVYPDVASTPDPGTQLLLLPLNASGLEWFRKALDNQDFIWKPRNPGFQIPRFPRRSRQSKDKVRDPERKKGRSRRTLAMGSHKVTLRLALLHLSMLSLTFLQYVQQHWLNSQTHRKDCSPSLGFVALLYALHTCDQISLIGFGPDKFLRWSHYWDDEYWFKTDLHSVESENQIISNLQCEGKVAVYH